LPESQSQNKDKEATIDTMAEALDFEALVAEDMRTMMCS
jgi:hypothetical protein